MERRVNSAPRAGIRHNVKKEISIAWLAEGVMKNAIVGLCLITLLCASCADKPGPKPGPLYPVNQNGKWGFIDKSGQIVIPPRYAWAGGFSENRALVSDGINYGYIDGEGRLVIGMSFSLFQTLHTSGLMQSRTYLAFSDGLAPFRSNGLYGFIDPHGKPVIPPKFKAVRGFSEGLAAVGEGWFLSGRGEFVLDGPCRYIDRTGRVVIDSPPGLAWPQDFAGGLARVAITGEKHNRLGYLNKNGELAIRTDYDFGGDFSDGLASVAAEQAGIGFLDASGKLVIGLQFHGARDFSGGLAPVLKDGAWGYVDKNGRVAVGFRFEDARSFTEGLAPVFLNEKWGYIDPSGKMVIFPRFESVWNFSEGIAGVSVGGKLGYIDKTGKTVWNPQ